jgi:hypothetical protein
MCMPLTQQRIFHKEMFPVYSGKCLSRKAVHSWVKKFSQRRLKIADDARSSRPVEIATEAAVRQWEVSFWADRRIQCNNCTRMFPWFSIQHNAWSFEVSESAQRTEGSRKMNQMCLSLQHLLRYADEGEDTLNRIDTEDESCVHHYQPESKRASVQWKHTSSPSTKKFKVMPSAVKVMLTMSLDSQGVLLAHSHKHGENVNSASYCKVLLKLRDAVRRKCPGQWAKVVLLYHDFARPHTARATQREFKNYSGNFLNIRFTARTWPLVISIYLVR